MSPAVVTHRVQRLLLVGVGFLLAWQVAALGRLAALVGAVGYAYLIVGLLRQNRR